MQVSCFVCKRLYRLYCILFGLTLIRVFGTITERVSWKKIQNHRWWRHSWDLENENCMSRQLVYLMILISNDICQYDGKYAMLNKNLCHFWDHHRARFVHGKVSKYITYTVWLIFEWLSVPSMTTLVVQLSGNEIQNNQLGSKSWIYFSWFCCQKTSRVTISESKRGFSSWC